MFPWVIGGLASPPLPAFATGAATRLILATAILVGVASLVTLAKTPFAGIGVRWPQLESPQGQPALSPFRSLARAGQDSSCQV